ncbi:hypothetical protein [Streptomyces sp. NBC_01506]|uniref:hypothetical protein n=1 Tax=Streptomyces sp. NBC_01506 TaxID=2903887 RepID=UPI00386C00F4
MSTTQPRTRLFFAADLRGSTRCFRKFLNAAEAYDADLLVLAGNLTGHRLIPMVGAGAGTGAGTGPRQTTLGGRPLHLETRREIAEFENAAADTGAYAVRVTPDVLHALDQDPSFVDRTFRRLATERLAEWLDMAFERPGPRPHRTVVSCGNDDPVELDTLIDTCAAVERADAAPVVVDDHHVLVGCGWTPISCWRSERERSEAEISRLLDDSVRQALAVREQVILDVHTPPYDSGIDDTPILDDTLRPRTEAGQPIFGPGGSTAVRQAIETHRPVLSLHGKTHEGRGAVRLGDTFAVNPGSESAEGILRGVVVDLGSHGMTTHLLTSG